MPMTNIIINLHRFINAPYWPSQYMKDKYGINCIGFDGGTNFSSWSDNPQMGIATMIDTINKFKVNSIYFEFGTRELPMLEENLHKLSNVKIILYANDAIDVTGYREHHDRYLSLLKIKNVQMFAVDGSFVDLAIKLGYKNIKWVPQYGFDEFFKKLSNCSKVYDMCFIGSLWHAQNTQREADLKFLYSKISHRKCLIAGDGRYITWFPQWTTMAKTGTKKQRGTHRDATRHINANKIYNQSRIILCTDLYTNKRCTSVRTMNALLSGSMVLLKYHEGFEEMFEDRKNIVFYRNNSDLIDNINHCLIHNNSRENVAKNGEILAQSSFLRINHIDRIFGDKLCI